MKALNLLMILFCFSFQSCYLSQNTPPANKLEVLDLKQYKDWELQEGSYEERLIYKLNDKTVGISTYDYEILLSKKDSSPFKVLKRYFPDTKRLFYKGAFFGNYSIGTSYSYDREGNLIEVINHDEHFSFSFYDLIAKIKKEYGIDIMVTKNFRGARRFYMKEWDRSFYTVFLYDIPVCCIRRILLDGNTGEFLYEDYIDEYAPTMYIEDIEDVISREVIEKEKIKE